MARPSPQTDRIVAVINLLIAHSGDGLTLSEIARRLRLNKATCYPMLVALTDAGFLTRRPARKTFHLGPALISAGHAAAAQNPGLEDARLAMSELAATLDLTCQVFAPARDHLRLVDQAWHSARDIPHLHIGQKVPMRPPSGSVCVAWSDEETFERWISDESFTPDDIAYYKAQLAAVRRNGYAIVLQASTHEGWRTLVRELKRTVTQEDRNRIMNILHSEMARQSNPMLSEIDADERYLVGNIEAPIFGADGGVAYTLAVTNLPELSGRQVLDLADKLRETAGRVSAVR